MLERKRMYVLDHLLESRLGSTMEPDTTPGDK